MPLNFCSLIFIIPKWHWKMLKNVDFGVKLPGFKFGLYNIIALWFWVSKESLLSLLFLGIKYIIIMSSSIMIHKIYKRLVHNKNSKTVDHYKYHHRHHHYHHLYHCSRGLVDNSKWTLLWCNKGYRSDNSFPGPARHGPFLPSWISYRSLHFFPKWTTSLLAFPA